MHTFQKPVYDKIREIDATSTPRWRRPVPARLRVDGSGLFMKYLRRGSGYYIDIGASQLIIDGKIKLKAGQVEEIVPEA